MQILVENLSFVYGEGTPFEKKALDLVNLQINEGEFIGIIGHTGSGKSTFVQHLNGLIKVQKGTIQVDGKNISDKGYVFKTLRQRVGLVFQYPEYQLFEETIAKDIAYGPINLGLSEAEIEERVKESMDKVGLEYDKVKERSPFELSGGQKRRVAIAGVLAMRPDVLILDEPTAGLDPKGRDEILEQILFLRRENPKVTIILVSHSMEDIAKMVDRLVVFSEGKIIKDGTPRMVFSDIDLLESVGLGVPQITKLSSVLGQKGLLTKDTILTVEEAKKQILEAIKRRK